MADQFKPLAAHDGHSLDQLHRKAQAYIARAAGLPIGQSYSLASDRFHKARQGEADAGDVAAELQAILDAEPEAVAAMVKAGTLMVAA